MESLVKRLLQSDRCNGMLAYYSSEDGSEQENQHLGYVVHKLDVG